MPAPPPPPPLPPPLRHITTLVYAFDRADRLCLLRRRKAPNLGLWSPPGGKVEPDETPLACAVRELAEETGLIGDAPRLVAVATEYDAVTGEAWLMFIVRVDVRDGTIRSDGREGEVAWVAPADVAALPAPPADASILAVVREAEVRGGVAFMGLRYERGHIAGVEITWG